MKNQEHFSAVKHQHADNEMMGYRSFW